MGMKMPLAKLILFGILNILFSPGESSTKLEYYPEWSPIRNNEGNRQVQYISTYGQYPPHYSHVNQKQRRRPVQGETFVPDPKPRHSEFNKKLGFGSLSSLLPTSILPIPQSESVGYAEGDGNSIDSGSGGVNSVGVESGFLGRIRQALKSAGETGNTQNPEIDSYVPFNTPSENNAEFGYAEENSQDVNDSVGGGTNILTKLKNSLPFGKGFLAGLLNSTQNSSESEETNNEQGYESSQVSFDPSQINLIGNANHNLDSNVNYIPPHDDDVDSSDSQTNSTDGILSKLPNPFERFRNILSNIKFPSFGDGNDDGGYDGDNQNELDLPSITEVDSDSYNPVGDLPSTPDLTALADLQEAFSSILTKFATTYGISKAKFVWFKVGIFIFGPILGGAIAATVIGIVYASIYLPAIAIANEGVEGQLAFVKFQQLLDILGLPDPFDQLRGFPSESGIENWRKIVLLAGTSHYRGKCFERLACEIIGKKWMKERIHSRIGRLLTWLNSKIVNETEDEKARSGESIVRKLKRLSKQAIKAIYTGLASENFHVRKDDENDVGRSAEEGNVNLCLIYACDPIKSFREIIASSTNRNNQTIQRVSQV